MRAIFRSTHETRKEALLRKHCIELAKHALMSTLMNINAWVTLRAKILDNELFGKERGHANHRKTAQVDFSIVEFNDLLRGITHGKAQRIKAQSAIQGVHGITEAQLLEKGSTIGLLEEDRQ